jgi:hypothetical protein
MIGRHKKCAILMSEVKHVISARSFRGDGGNEWYCAAQETEATTVDRSPRRGFYTAR